MFQTMETLPSQVAKTKSMLGYTNECVGLKPYYASQNTLTLDLKSVHLEQMLGSMQGPKIIFVFCHVMTPW